MKHASLRNEPSDLIAGQVIPIPGQRLLSHNPARPADIVHACSPRVEHAELAVRAARAALPAWSSWPVERRVEALRAYQSLVKQREPAIAELICDEVGKAMWESQAEAKALAEKVDITLAEGPSTGRSRVAPFDVKVSDTRAGRCVFRPHGVMAVVGPFNFPAHLPNGHIVPALLTGNTIVLKPSDKTPAIGQLLAELFIEALESSGAPPGVVNLVQGGADVAAALVNHDDIDGILFTGSWPVGRRILEANLDRPGRIIALELGGNNPAIIMPDCDLKQAAIEVARSAFATTGQRCTCTRRAIIHRDIAPSFIPLLQKLASNLLVGDPRGVAGNPVFCGPIIRRESIDAALAFQRQAAALGARVLLESTAMESVSKGYYITPGIIEVPGFSLADDPRADAGADFEVFGPLLRLAVVDSFDAALKQANTTRYGLASAIFTRNAEHQRRFLAESRAGCVNVNTGTAGASSKLPFGGLGRSGNHRPAGSFSLDYTAYPVASLVEASDAVSVPTGMRWEESWAR